MSNSGNNTRTGIFIGSLSGMCFATYGTFVNFLKEYGLSPETLTVILPLVLTFYFGISLYIKNKQAFKVPPKMILFLIALGVIAFDGQNYSMAQAYSRLPFGLVASVVFANLILNMIGSWILFGNKLTKTKITVGMICIIGVVLVVDLIPVIMGDDFSFNPEDLLWVFSGMFLIAYSYLGMKYAMEAGIDGKAVFFYMCLFATIGWWTCMVSPAQMINEIFTTISNGGLITFILYILIFCILCFHLWQIAIEKSDPSWVGVGYSFDPIFEIIFGFLIFNQVMNGLQLLGIVLILCTVSYITIQDAKQEALLRETTEQVASEP